jgi:hypothetical protein
MNSHNDLQTYLEEVALRPRLRLAADGKSASQGGLNLPDIRSFIIQKESLFNEKTGVIKKSFEDFHKYINSLQRSQLNDLLADILDAEARPATATQQSKSVMSQNKTSASPATSVAVPEVAPSTPKSVAGTAAASPATSVTAPEVAPSTPKSVAGTAAASPATPLTAQKAAPVKADDGRPALEALLKEMGIDLARLQNAVCGKSISGGGLNITEIKAVLQHFNQNAAGGRKELESKLSLLLSSLGVQ